MTTTIDTDAIIEVLESAGECMAGSGRAETRAIAHEWEDAGFVADDVAAWSAARCFDPGMARELYQAGYSPDWATQRIYIEQGQYTDTIGYGLSNSDLSLDDFE